MNAKARWPAAEGLDWLATMVALVQRDGHCMLVNSMVENVLGVSRRSLERGNILDWFEDPAALADTLCAVADNEVSTGRFDGQLRRSFTADPEDGLLVHVIVNQTEHTDVLLVEMIEIEQQTRQHREERALEQVQAGKELVRNLAHEIKNPLGGIRGAAQLLALEVSGSRELTEYTEVIIHEADRLQALVDRLLAPHRNPHVVGDVNIHEVCERVRSLVLVEYPRGLVIQRDYDTSLPEFRGDREQLIQAVLNIVQNAAQALQEQMADDNARIVLRTRAARQVTIGKQRSRLALELHIEDNGPGVPDSLKDRLFHPLVSGREGGSGLGLTLAQTFVQQHRGTITCSSVPGRALFSILLPLP
ncbi:MAG: ATP-binding protein [Rubrivivax sp.]|jgi:two-component system nitrogen regulation sensor histidine kinase GlnL|nr:ATP-binding protein [Rubrivivax sp.]